MKKLIINCLILLSITSYLLPTAKAAESSPSSSIKEKLQELQAQIASKAAKLKQEIDKKLQNKAYIGKVKSKSDNSITLAARTGPKIVSINQDTLFESTLKSKQKFSQKTLAEDDYLAALGDVDETGVLIAKKVILLPPPPAEIKTYLWGQVVSVSDKLITIKGKDLKNISITLPKNSTIKLNQFLILTGIFGENEILEAEFVHVIEKGGILKPKTATSSASPSASAKQTAKP